MLRIPILGFYLLAALGFLFSCNSNSNTKKIPPNIILVMADEVAFDFTEGRISFISDYFKDTSFAQ